MLLTRAIKVAGGVAHEAADGNAGIRILERTTVDLVVIDIIMPEKEGAETILEIKERWPSLKVLAISGGGRIGPETFLSLAEGLGADATMKKPLNFDTLIAQIATLLAETKAA